MEREREVVKVQVSLCLCATFMGADLRSELICILCVGKLRRFYMLIGTKCKCNVWITMFVQGRLIRPKKRRITSVAHIKRS